MCDYHYWFILNEPSLAALHIWAEWQVCGPQNISCADIIFIYIVCLAKARRPRENLLKWSLFIQFIKQEYLKGFHLEEQVDLFCLAPECRSKSNG